MSSQPDVLVSATGFPTELGYFMAGMDELRGRLSEAIADMSSQQLGCRAVPGAHSIAALVLHIGEAEWYWMQMVVNGQRLTDDVRQSAFWDALDNPDSFAEKNYSAEFCLDQAEKIREQTRQLLATFNDKDLDRIFSRKKRGEITEHSLRWILHHLMDHESEHRGQILMLRRLLSEQNQG